MFHCLVGLDAGLCLGTGGVPNLTTPECHPVGRYIWIQLHHFILLLALSFLIPPNKITFRFLLQKKHSYGYGTYQPKIRISHPAKQFEPSHILDSICCHNIILTILYPKRNIAFERHSRPFPGVHLQSMERWVVTHLTPFGAKRISVLWSEGKHPLQISGSP